ncbi:Wolframin-like [Homarus americanus]|uniref:Wolframin-like n=1 Tax=Homarus americanus TaxID=6706 RepID=A0A8J5TL42_HOMAM|nr:Wolframin-like [Homarus americanus]
MAATLPSDGHLQEATTKKTSRRQWSVQGALRRMRSQLAEDACPESQLVMGKTLRAVGSGSRGRQRGSAFGSVLADPGIPSRQQRGNNTASRLVSDGNDIISSCGLASKVQEVLAGGDKDDMEADGQQKNPKEPESYANLEERYGGERFTEDHVVSGSVLYYQGRVPPMHHFLTLNSYTSNPLFLQAINWPRRNLERIFPSCIHFLGVVLTNYIIKVLRLLTPVTSGLIICFLGSLMSLFGAEYVIVFLPVIVSCVSVIVMIVSSVHMLLNRKRFDSFRVWSLVFSHYCPELDVDQAEGRFKSRCWKPYATMCVAVFFYLSTVPLTSPKLMIIFLPIICFTAITTFLYVPEKLTRWQFLSLTVYILAMTPSAHGSISSWLVSVSKGTGLEYLFMEDHIDIFWKVKLHLGVGPILHLVWFILQFVIVVRSGPSHLPPHLVSVLWCHLAIVASQKVAAPTDLLYPVVGWSILVLLPTIASIMLFVGPALICVGLGFHGGINYQILILIFCSVLFILGFLKHWCPNLILVCKWVVMGVMVLLFLHPSLFVKSSPKQYTNLQWESYKNVCLPSKETGAVTTHGCLPLKETLVKWQGSIAQVNIINITTYPTLLSQCYRQC